MSEILDKLSSYNIFNYLLPGIVFVFIVEGCTSISIHHDEVIVMIFISYFIGLVISRIGSICIEPILKKIAVHSTYEDYVKALRKDDHIAIFSEQNNMYRTLISMLLCLIVVFFYDSQAANFEFLSKYNHYILVSVLLPILILAYRKQTIYIRKRVNIQSSTRNDENKN